MGFSRKPIAHRVPGGLWQNGQINSEAVSALNSRPATSFAVRWRGKPVVRNEETPARQTPVAHHQILHALSSPSPSTLSWDALPREPVGHLSVVVANLSDRRLDEGRIGQGIVIGKIVEPSSAEARKSPCSITRHRVKALLEFCIHGATP
jgi:hypothetical protein